VTAVVATDSLGATARGHEPNRKDRRSSAIEHAVHAGLDDVWMLAARADAVDAAARGTLADALIGLGDVLVGRVLLVTCHRVELYGLGPMPELEIVDASVAGLRWLERQDAVEHLLRLAAGTESSVLGEDQILHQIRSSLREAQAHGPIDPRLGRLVQLSLAVGRQARAGWAPAERSLADRALGRLEASVGPLRGRMLLVVGTGEMGAELIRAAGVRGARLTIASRGLAHARRAAEAVGGEPVDLAEAARRAPGAAAIAIALSGAWRELDQIDATLPPTIELSSPTALSSSVRGGLGERYTGIDDLFSTPLGSWLSMGRTSDRGAGVAVMPEHDEETPAVPAATRGSTAVAGRDADAFLERASALVDEAVQSYAAWTASRRSVATIKTITARAEARRREQLDRLLKRLPDLGSRERDLIATLSSQLVAAILHDPLVRLREDRDGSAAEAARELFGL